SRRRHTRFSRDWSSDVCSSDLFTAGDARLAFERRDRMLRFAATDLAAAERTFSGNARELAKLGTYGDSIASLLESQERLRGMDRSEERRVGKAGTSREWAQEQR